MVAIDKNLWDWKKNSLPWFFGNLIDGKFLDHICFFFGKHGMCFLDTVICFIPK